MATAFKKSEQQLASLREELDLQRAVQVGPETSALQWGADVANLCSALQELSGTVGKMVMKAKETDPDKQVYGKSMIAKVLDLGSRLDAAVKEAGELRDKVAPLAEAEAARIAAEEAARKAAEEEEEARKAAEEAARVAAEEEAARVAAEREAARVAAEREAARAAAEEAEAARRRAAQEQEAVRLAEKAEADKAAAEAELRKQAEDAAKALAAAAAASSQQPPPSAAAAAAPAAEPPSSSALTGGKVIKVMDGGSELRRILVDAGPARLVVVDFSAPWCGPCRAIAPFLDQLAAEHSSSCVFVAVDCEATPANRALAAEAAIRAFPTFHFYKGSQRVHEMRGANREGIRLQISAHAPNAAATSAGSAAPPTRAPGQMTKDLMAALQVLKSNCSFDELCTGTRTLVTFVSNVLAHPGDPKYRRVRMSNARFSSALGVRTGGVACMEAVGFRKAQEGSDWFLVMDSVAPDLQQVKAMLEEAMRSLAPPPTAAPTIPPPAPGLGLSGTDSSPFGNLSGLGGLAGGSFGAPPTGMDAMMQQMMSNPQMMQAAMRMMQNPQMMSSIQNMMAGGRMDPAVMTQLSQQMMADPAMQQAAMQMMGGLGAGMMGQVPAAAPQSAFSPFGQQSSQPPPPLQQQPPSTAQAAAPAAAAGAGNEQDMGNMSEEELLQLALRQSMEDQPGNNGDGQ